MFRHVNHFMHAWCLSTLQTHACCRKCASAPPGFTLFGYFNAFLVLKIQWLFIYKILWDRLTSIITWWQYSSWHIMRVNEFWTSNYPLKPGQLILPGVEHTPSRQRAQKNLNMAARSTALQLRPSHNANYLLWHAEIPHRWGFTRLLAACQGQVLSARSTTRRW